MEKCIEIQNVSIQKEYLNQVNGSFDDHDLVVVCHSLEGWFNLTLAELGFFVLINESDDAI